MQKKVIKIITGYLILICLVGAGLLIKRQIDSIPVVDDAFIQELLESAEKPGNENNQTAKTPQDGTENNNNEKKEDPGSNYWENYYKETEKDKEEKDPVISQIQKEITTGDKLRIMKIVQKNLSSEDIKYILSLLKDGVTKQEQIEVKSILQKKIGAEEKEELKTILLKYL